MELSKLAEHMPVKRNGIEKTNAFFSVAAASPNHNKFMNDAACILEDTIIWARKRGIKTIVIICEDYMQVSFQSGPIQFY